MVGTLAVPLALAFAIASGVPPEVSVLGGSRVQIGAPRASSSSSSTASRRSTGSTGEAQPLVALERAGRLDRYRRQNLAGDLDEALERAREILSRVPGATP